MEHLLGRFSLGTILRHFVCGLICVGTVFWCQPEWARELAARKDFVYIVLLMALPAGMLIYAISRSLFGVVVEYIRDWCISKKIDRYILNQESKRLLARRWLAHLRAEKGDEKFICNQIEAWGDYIHLLYTSGIAVVIGCLCSVADLNCGDMMFSWAKFLACCFLFTFGFISDMRKRIAEDIFFKNLEGESAELTSNPDNNKQHKSRCLITCALIAIVSLQFVIIMWCWCPFEKIFNTLGS